MTSDSCDQLGERDLFSALLQALPVAVYTTDAAGFISSFNPAAAALAGRSPVIGQDRWCVTWRLYWPDGRAMSHAECPMAIALQQNRIVRGAEAIAERPNGTRFKFRPYPTPVRDSLGRVVAGINVLIDTTERHKIRRTQPTAAAAALEGRLFAVLRLIEAVLADAQQLARGAEAKSLIAATAERIAAISVTQGFLGEAPEDRRIGSWDLLSATCVIVQPSLPKGVALHCDSTASDLAGETALPLALIARELIIAAAERRQGSGVVHVALQKEAAGGYVLTVDGGGAGPPAPAQSFELVAALARQLNGEFAVESGPGIRYVLRFPDPRTLH